MTHADCDLAASGCGRGRQLLDRWQHEARRVGAPALAAPLVLALGGSAFLVLMHAVHQPIGRTAGTLLEAVIPLGAAIAVAGLASADPALELQLSLPTEYRSTLSRRCALTVGCSALVAVALSSALTALRAWTPGTDAVAGQLTWLAPLLVLCAVAAAAAASTASAASAVGVVAALWVGEEWFKTALITPTWSQHVYLFATARADQPPYLVRGALTSAWLLNRGALLAVAVGLTVVAWFALRRTDHLLSHRARS